MLKRKWSLVEKIILIGVVAFGLFIIGFQIKMKGTDKEIYLVKGFSGWVNIRYNVPGAPALPKKEGKWQVEIPASGTLITSTPYEDKWRRDDFYFKDSTGALVAIPKSEKSGNEYKKRIHWHESAYHSFEFLAKKLKPGTDTTFYDGSRLYTEKDTFYYKEGVKSIEYFYVSEQPENMLFNPPSNPDTNIFIPRLKKVLTK